MFIKMFINVIYSNCILFSFYITQSRSSIFFTAVLHCCISSTCVAHTNRYTPWPSLCHLSPGSSMVSVSPEIRRLRVRFPSGAQKHFSEFAIKLEQQNSFPLIYQAASHPHIYIFFVICFTISHGYTIVFEVSHVQAIRTLAPVNCEPIKA